jgi:nucleoside-diphosphate-sugar epimerase
MAIQTGRISIVGSGDNKLNMVYAGDVAEGLILAAHHAWAAGQAYNLSSEGEITQRELLDLLCDAIGQPRVTRRVSLKMAYRFGLFSECVGRLIRLKRAPYVTRRGVALISRPTQFSSEKARRELGWSPQVGIYEGLRRELEWLSSHAA